MTTLPFTQLDVFSREAFRGNPLAVVHDADAVTEADMAAFARWTNLSETTFLLAPQDPGADYRVRIFTPAGELPFAGHPTLGSCRAWLEAGGVPADAAQVVQECGAGLVRVRVDGDELAFAAPPLVRSGPVDADTLSEVARALGLGPSDVRASAWVDNGPGWLGLWLTDADRVLAVRPDAVALGEHKVGIAGRHRDGGPADIEVRAFFPGGVGEDPVTGSLNASLAMWLVGLGELPPRYTAAQGTALGRAGRVSISTDDAGQIWVGGVAVPIVTGSVAMPTA